MGWPASVFRTIIWPGVKSVTVPVLSVVVVVVSVVPLAPATVVEVEDVCPYAKPMKAMAEAILTNNLIIMTFYLTKLLQ